MKYALVVFLCTVMKSAIIYIVALSVMIVLIAATIHVLIAVMKDADAMIAAVNIAAAFAVRAAAVWGVVLLVVIAVVQTADAVIAAANVAEASAIRAAVV